MLLRLVALVMVMKLTITVMTFISGIDMTITAMTFISDIDMTITVMTFINGIDRTRRQRWPMKRCQVVMKTKVIMMLTWRRWRERASSGKMRMMMTMTIAPVGFALVYFLLWLHDEGFLLFWCTDCNKAKKQADVYGFTGETRGLDKLTGDGMKEQRIYTG